STRRLIVGRRDFVRAAGGGRSARARVVTLIGTSCRRRDLRGLIRLRRRSPGLYLHASFAGRQFEALRMLSAGHGPRSDRVASLRALLDGAPAARTLCRLGLRLVPEEHGG